MFLLDTNLVSELRKAKSGNADANVVAWAAERTAATLFLSAVTILEIEIGVLRAERRDPRQGSVLRRWLEGNVLTAFANRTLAFDTEVARRCAHLHVPDPRSHRDAMIAATALVHGLTVATRNTADFPDVAVVDPWLAA